MLFRDQDFKVRLRGLRINNRRMEDTQKQNMAFIDSGTTFTYVSLKNYNQIKKYFEWFCSLDPENHCKGTMNFRRQGYLCFSYDQSEFPDGPYDYFRSFPVLSFELGPERGGYILEWYPSEYLYREKNFRYCVALDVQNNSEMTIGGTLMRQHNFVFDVD